MENNKCKPKLVAEHPAACRRRRDGAAATCDDVVAASRWVDCGCPRAGDGGEPTLHRLYDRSEDGKHCINSLGAHRSGL